MGKNLDKTKCSFFRSPSSCSKNKSKIQCSQKKIPLSTIGIFLAYSWIISICKSTKFAAFFTKVFIRMHIWRQQFFDKFDPPPHLWYHTLSFIPPPLMICFSVSKNSFYFFPLHFYMFALIYTYMVIYIYYLHT